MVEHELAEILARAGSNDADFSVEARVLAAREPFEVAEQEPVVEMLVRHATAGLGYEPKTVGVPFWADSAILADAGIPTVLFGPRGEGAHAEIEWVDVGDLGRCVEIYAAVAADLCV